MMRFKSMLNLFNKTEVQEDRELVIHNDKTRNMSLRGAERRGNLFNKLDCFAYARNDDSCAEHIEKDLSSNRLSVLTTLKKAAFTKPSRGTSKARDEFQSTKMLNFRCWNERCRLMRGAAFTLAEVLITLGIIGVVAALTLPTLIANHQKQTLVNQLKKAVNTIENAARMAVADEGVSSFQDTLLYCTLSDAYNCPLLGTEDSEIAQNTPAVVNKYFKTISVDHDSNLMFRFYDAYKLINGENIDAVGRKMVLNDGAIVYLRPGKFFEIDVNGDKGPNIYGRDYFPLVLDTNGKVADSSTFNWDNQVVDNSICSTFLDNGGDVVEGNECFYYKIVFDGWKMNY